MTVALLDVSPPRIGIDQTGRPCWSLDLLTAGAVVHRLDVAISPDGGTEANLEHLAGLWLSHGRIEAIERYLRDGPAPWWNGG